MKFIETSLKGLHIIELELFEDERDFFARSFCKKEFKEHGLKENYVQCSVSLNRKKGTLRGLHYQAKPYEETKLVMCTAGAMYDVIIDLRPDSSSYCECFTVELSANYSNPNSNYKMLYIPEGMAHGFQTLEDDTVVFYQMSEFYHPECTRGVRWNDPAFGIKWPYTPSIISLRDQQYEDFKV